VGRRERETMGWSVAEEQKRREWERKFIWNGLS
jgi:hypothetical protein